MPVSYTATCVDHFRTSQSPLQRTEADVTAELWSPGTSGGPEPSPDSSPDTTERRNRLEGILSRTGDQDEPCSVTLLPRSKDTNNPSSALQTLYWNNADIHFSSCLCNQQTTPCPGELGAGLEIQTMVLCMPSQFRPGHWAPIMGELALLSCSPLPTRQVHGKTHA